MRAGTRFGEYEILDVAGRGGMGVVYRARQTRLARSVALKVIAEKDARDQEFRARFLRESRLAAAIDHPNIVPIFDAGQIDDRPYIAMQWVDGETLHEMIKRPRAMPIDRAASIIVQVAGALDVANARGLLHRDVKPANILVQRLGDRDCAYLTDFGISKVMDDDAPRLTWTGRAVGTPGYQAPEQIRGESGDQRSDVYALGCVLFEALAGQPPFAGPNADAIRWSHARDERPLPSSAHAAARPFDPVVQRAMALDPAQRFATNAQFAQALQAVLGHTATHVDTMISGSGEHGEDPAVRIRSSKRRPADVSLHRHSAEPLDVSLNKTPRPWIDKQRGV